MTKQIVVLNGPNLNRLGTREPEIYGAQTLDDVRQLCRAACERAGFEMIFRQSNHEGHLVDWIQEADEAAAIIINPAAYSHTSVAVMDALKNYRGRIIEVHISNIHKREAFRHHSYVSGVADAVICGCGVHGYVLAIEAAAELCRDKNVHQ